MKVILLQDISKVGKKREIKEVSAGYARNFLFPKKLAEPASHNILHTLYANIKKETEKKTEESKTYQSIAEKLSHTTLHITMKIGEKGKTFGSVHATTIAEALKQMKIIVEKDWIDIGTPIKSIGNHPVHVKFPQGITATFHVEVTPEKE